MKLHRQNASLFPTFLGGLSYVVYEHGAKQMMQPVLAPADIGVSYFNELDAGYRLDETMCTDGRPLRLDVPPIQYGPPRWIVWPETSAFPDEPAMDPTLSSRPPAAVNTSLLYTLATSTSSPILTTSTTIAGYAIPWTIHQTSKHTPDSQSVVVKNIMNLLKKNKGWEYSLLTDENGKSLEFLKENFEPKVVKAFQSLKIGAAKSDLLRCCMLYHHGGLYLDLDTGLDDNIIKDELILANDSLALFYDRNGNIVQHLFFSAPQHGFLRRVIDETVDRIEKRVANIWLATGPHMFSDVFFSMATGKNINRSKSSVKLTQRLHILKQHANFMGGRVQPERDWRIQLKAKGFSLRSSSHLGPNETHYKLRDGPTPLLLLGCIGEQRRVSCRWDRLIDCFKGLMSNAAASEIQKSKKLYCCLAFSMKLPQRLQGATGESDGS